nr:ABC transporter permease [uncultured Anaerostipes sp.]
MKNLLKAELLKFKKDYFIWGICIVLIICACFSILTDVYISVENALLCLGKDYMVLLLSFAIYAGFTLTDEFSNRTIIHIITCGNKRLSFLVVKGLHYTLGCTIIVTLYFGVSVLVSMVTLETNLPLTDLFHNLIVNLILSIPLYLSIATIFFLIAFLLKRATLTMGISVAFSIIGVVFTNKVYYASPIQMQNMLQYLPTIQLPMIFEHTFYLNDYLITLILSISIIFVSFIGSFFILEKAEL